MTAVTTLAEVLRRHTGSARLDGRTAVVTGAGRGMGATHAAVLAGRGARVLLVDRDEPELDATVELLRAEGADADAIAVDITTEEAATSIVERAVSRFGGLDVLVHNAGIVHDFQPLAQTSNANVQRYLDVNVLAPLAITRSAVPHLRVSASPRVIFISSQWGQVPDGHSYGYMVSKAAQLGLMKTLAKELVGDKILVNAVTPGAVRTRMVPDHAYEAEVAAVPLGRLGEPEEISTAVAFLASDDAAFLTGQTIPVNGGALVVGI